MQIQQRLAGNSPANRSLGLPRHGARFSGVISTRPSVESALAASFQLSNGDTLTGLDLLKQLRTIEQAFQSQIVSQETVVGALVRQVAPRKTFPLPIRKIIMAYPDTPKDHFRVHELLAQLVQAGLLQSIDTFGKVMPRGPWSEFIPSPRLYSPGHTSYTITRKGRQALA